jgi:hypothetical protein
MTDCELKRAISQWQDIPQDGGDMFAIPPPALP